MFRSAEAYKAETHGLTLVVAADFDEWRIFLQGPDVIIHGGRQFTGNKAKEHAARMADDYIREQLGESPSEPQQLEWVRLSDRKWLNWRP